MFKRTAKEGIDYSVYDARKTRRKETVLEKVDYYFIPHAYIKPNLISFSIVNVK